MNVGMFQRTRRLEDEFFARQDAILIAKQRELARMEQTQKAMAEISGIANPQVLRRLIELEIKPETLATLAVVPLVEVAWADGDVHERERAAILEGTAGAGWLKGSVDYVLLEEWLKMRPPAKLLEAWTQYVAGLCESLSAEEREGLRKDLLSRARAVAEAAGGFLGLTSRISLEEQDMLDRMDAAFSPAGGATAQGR